MDNLEYEKDLINKGYNIIAGVDEVGRGPLNGPVVAACAIINSDIDLEGITDSKKITEKKREKLYDYLTKNVIYGIGEASPKEIDELNMLNATKLAMKRAIDEVKKQTNIDYLLIDGNMKFDLDIPYKSIVKGDSKSISISAASVIAKVTRDHEMYELDKKYPMYGYKDHKGYPTKKHLENISKYGILSNYRCSYKPVQKIIEMRNFSENNEK
jgi:ribonuclease HII